MKDPDTSINAVLLAGAMLYSDVADELREAMLLHWNQLLDAPTPPPAAG